MSDNPTGYIYAPDEITATLATGLYPASATVDGITGAAKASKLNYFNLTAFAADFLRSTPSAAGPRKLIDCGADGMVLEPLAQQTGICNGCSHGEAAFLSWCHRYVTSGGPVPSRCSFAWAYLTGRESRYVGRGDTGAVPSCTVRAYHDFGVLPTDDTDFAGLAPHGANSEESICIQYRDNPKVFIEKYRAAAEPWKCRVYSPDDPWDVADCHQTGRPVTYGTGVQVNQAIPGSNGISSLYRLNGGHETLGSGWFLFNGRLGGIKTESWWNADRYPGSKWPNNRVVIMTDDGPRTLYPGQSAFWLDDWLRNSVESWAISAPAEA